MGSLVLYIMEWAFALIVLLTIYKAVFSGTTFYRFNRFYLLGATVLSALLPLVHITVPVTTPVVSDMAIERMEFAQELSGTFVLIDEPQIAVTEPARPVRETSLWAVTLVCMYSAYVLMLTIGWVRSIIRTRRFLRGKTRRRISRTVWLVTHDEDFGPFSWMNYIVISDTENGFARRASLRHEYSHVRLMHSMDLIILLACTIVNPVCWLVLQEIKIVHEYEADSEVINRYGIRNSDYQKLLIMRTVGAEAYALASSFNLNIKKRIIMLNKNQTGKRRLMWLLLLIPLLGMTSVLFARTEETFNIDQASDITETYLETDAYEEQVKTFKGRVVNEQGEPVADALVAEVTNTAIASNIYNSTRTTDKNGEFSFSTSSQNGKFLTISKDGYKAVKIDLSNASDQLTLTLERDGSGKETGTDDVIENPEFPGGTIQMLTYLQRTIRYPKECRDSDIQGRVLISFVIDKEGNVTNATVSKSAHPLLDDEALRVVKMMPQWTPGKINGVVADLEYTVPINFRLSSEPKADDWVYLYKANEINSDMVMALSAASVEELGDLNTPQVRELIKTFKEAQKEAEAMQTKYQEEMQADQAELDRVTDEAVKIEGQELLRQKYAEYQKKLIAKSEELTEMIKAKADDAWKSISKTDVYICVNHFHGNPASQIKTTPDNLESAMKELFEGRRPALSVDSSDETYKKMTELLKEKHSGKKVFYLNR